MAGIKQFIVRRLKENIPLSEIRNELKGKGYDLESANKAIRDVISGVGKKTPDIARVQIGVIVIGIVVAIVLAFYLTSKNEASSFQELCSQYATMHTQVTCSDAVKTVLQSYSGEAISVEFDNVTHRGKFILRGETTPQQGDEIKEMWFVDIVLDKYIVTESGNSGKIQVAVDGSNKSTFIYRFEGF